MSVCTCSAFSILYLLSVTMPLALTQTNLVHSRASKLWLGLAERVENGDRSLDVLDLFVSADLALYCQRAFVSE